MSRPVIAASLAPLLALVPALAPARAADDCGDCGARGPCRPHAEADEAAIERLRPELEAPEVERRLDALAEVAALTGEHANAPGEAVAEALAAALEDDALRVREEAVRLLVDGQHPERTVRALVDVMKDFQRNMWTLVAWLTGPDGERGTIAEAMDYLETVGDVAGGVRDDRVAKELADLLLAYPEEMRGQPVAMAATGSLLRLGTRDAVRAVIRQLRPWSDDGRSLAIHEALEEFAEDRELPAAPEAGPDAAKAWDAWLKKNARALPSKLGKWAGSSAEDG